MGARRETERVGFGLAAAGIAYLGTYLALFSMGFLGLNSGAPVVIFAAFLVVIPTALVATVLWALGTNAPFRLHPFVTALGTFVGGLLSFPFFQPLGFTGLLAMPMLLTYATFMVAQFLLDRPSLSGVELMVDSTGTLLLYSLFAAYPLGIALGMVDTTGCDGCGKTANLITAAVVLGFALTVIVVAATRYARGRGPAKSVSSDTGTSH